jgi:hypothetical protein
LEGVLSVGSTTITSGFISDLSASATTPFGCYLAGPTDPLAHEAKLLEQAIFLETFGNTAECLEAEYGPFDDCSLYVVVVDHQLAQVVGMIRLIFDKHGRLKSLGDIELGPWNQPVDEVLARTGLDDFDMSETLDGATLAVHPDYRQSRSSNLVSFSMYSAMLALARAARMRWFVTIFDVIVLDSIQKSMGDPFDFFAGIEPMRYLDSPLSIPVYLDMETHAAQMRAFDPELEDLFYGGMPFPGAVSPADHERGAEVARSLTSTPIIDLRDHVGAEERSGSDLAQRS